MKSKTLLIILAILVILLSLNYYMDIKKGDRTLLADLVDADTSEISTISIYPKAFNKKEIKFIKEGDEWMLAFDDIKTGTDENTMKSILGEIQNLKPARLASTSDSKWEKYEVNDSLGIEVKITDNDGELTELVFGKFDYNQQNRKSASYVRLAGEEEVYAVDGYLSMTFDRGPESFRNRSLIEANHLLWTRITYNYPGDSSFVMISEKGRWHIDGIGTDSLSTTNYLASMSRLGGNQFVDDFDISQSTPSHTIVFEGENLETITLDAYPTGDAHGYAIVSSENKHAIVSGGSDLFDRTFISKNTYLTGQ
ncbi:MAG: DUF4340 domain-containing protein [Bacteroidota bacterium]|nr:DUF4340 domain-containing protein [Bacteroidota bacterium]